MNSHAEHRNFGGLFIAVYLRLRARNKAIIHTTPKVVDTFRLLKIDDFKSAVGPGKLADSTCAVARERSKKLFPEKLSSQ